VRLELPAGLDGLRRRIRRGGYPSRKAALEVLGRLRAPRSGETGGILTVGDWLAHWLASRTSPAASTVRGYAAHVRLYLGPYLGEVLLTELTVGQVQAMFTAITRQHQALGAPVSAATLARIRATLRAALNAAIRQGLITDNPAARAELPRARRPRALVVGSGRSALPGLLPVGFSGPPAEPGVRLSPHRALRVPCPLAMFAAGGSTGSVSVPRGSGSGSRGQLMRR